MPNTGNLKVTLPSDREIVMVRLFDAPAVMVYEAYTNPELLKKWFGPDGWRLTQCDIDLRVGGKWRYMLEGPNGARMGMSGEYVKLEPVSGSVHLERFDDYPGQSIVAIVLTEENGRTTFTATVTYESKLIRDAVMQSGMQHGAAETYDKLDGLLAQSHGTFQ